MLQYLLSSRLIQTGLVFCVLSVSGSFLYSGHVKRTTDKELAQHQRFLEGLPIQNEIRTAADTRDTSEVDVSETQTLLFTDASQDANATEVSPSDDVAFDDLADAFLPDDVVLEEEPLEDVPVSPYGFGPYPEVPVGFSEHLMPVWTMSEDEKERLAGRLVDFELMSRVLIKLWNQGDRDFVGVLRRDNDGKVYPTYPNTMYVSEWSEMDTKYGIVRYPSACFGAARIPPIFPYVMKHGRVPEDVKFID